MLRQDARCTSSRCAGLPPPHSLPTCLPREDIIEPGSFLPPRPLAPVLRTVAGVLHLGNVDFTLSSRDEAAVAGGAGIAALEAAARLLGVSRAAQGRAAGMGLVEGLPSLRGWRRYGLAPALLPGYGFCCELCTPAHVPTFAYIDPRPPTH